MRHHRLLAEVLVLSKDSAPKAYKKLKFISVFPSFTGNTHTKTKCSKHHLLLLSHVLVSEPRTNCIGSNGRGGCEIQLDNISLLAVE